MYKTIDFNNTTIRFKDEGKGTVVVLLHGYLESLEIWNECFIRFTFFNRNCM